MDARTNLLETGYYCFQLDSSHPDALAALGGTCIDYYISSTGEPGAIRLCYIEEGTGKCKSSALMHCSNAPPAAPFPPTPPPPLSQRWSQI